VAGVDSIRDPRKEQLEAMSTGNSSTTPVAIVGGGPVGLVLALLLDRHGVRSVVFELDDSPRRHPKGNTHNARSMEHYRRLGIAGQIRRLGLPPDHPTDVAYFTRYNAHELARLRMPSLDEKMRAVAAAPRPDQVPEPLHRANQMYVEQFLLQHVRTRPNITLRLGWRVDGLRQEDDGVSLHAERVSDGAWQTWRARYVAGCDGGQSLVRRTAGIRYEGEGSIDQDILGRRAAATHLRLPTLSRDILAGRHAWTYWAVNPELVMTLISLNGADEFFLLTSSVDPDQPDPAVLTQLVQRAASSPIPVEVLGHRPWTPGVALVAERFAIGRVLLAGDAAHLFTPTGGFGMNTGLDDAANLAWKLAAMVEGWGGPGLVQSYELERRPIALRNTAAARQLNKNLGNIELPDALEERSEAGGEARRRVGALLSTFGEQFASIGVQLGARYDDSPIVASDGVPPPDSLTTYAPSSAPGGRAPHLWLDDWHGVGSSLFDRFGVGMTVLRLGARPADTAELMEAARERGIPLTTLDIDDPVARDLYERDLVLVRPDQHVAWRGNRLPEDPDDLLARATGASRRRAAGAAHTATTGKEQ
jgi:2-polyprenyl-6-methoxyphenol hydroxylase-like FAD-dependent oxidoreductase